MDFVGSLEKLREIQQVVRAIEQGDPDIAEPNQDESYHDHRIEVTYKRGKNFPLKPKMWVNEKSNQLIANTDIKVAPPTSVRPGELR